MKKIVILLAVPIILFSGCTMNQEFSVGNQIIDVESKYTPYITVNALSAYEIGGDYLIVIVDDGIIQKSAEFSAERKCNRVQGMDLIVEDNFNRFLNMDFSKVEEQFGQPYFDAGNGFYIPAYITEDAKLICFEIENSIIFGIFGRDLFTNQIVNWIN